MSDQADSNERFLELTTDIVSAYVSNNSVPAADLSALIASVNTALSELRQEVKAEPRVKVPAVNPKRSVREDHIVCLEDGKKFKSLKGHLMSGHGLSPDDYRAKWNLPADYPMVAPEYAAARSELAKKSGLGRKSKAGPVAATPKRARRAD